MLFLGENLKSCLSKLMPDRWVSGRILLVNQAENLSALTGDAKVIHFAVSLKCACLSVSLTSTLKDSNKQIRCNHAVAYKSLVYDDDVSGLERRAQGIGVCGLVYLQSGHKYGELYRPRSCCGSMGSEWYSSYRARFDECM